MKFKRGDKVKFKSSHSDNAMFFQKGLTNLTIINNPDNDNYDYNVSESDDSNTWGVNELELELEKINWRNVI